MTRAGNTATRRRATEIRSVVRCMLRALACALGHAYGPQPERNVFCATDGGKTWTNVTKNLSSLPP